MSCKCKNIIENFQGGTIPLDTSFLGDVSVPQLNITTSYTPTSSGDTYGDIGSLTWDDTYVYVKTNSGWGRTTLDYTF
jgi:hypothetical protein